jgi:hypothetical protein
LDPPYQRRSVWNQSFKDYFVDTILLNYPAPALFLYEEITPDGRSVYHVVDGKQRLTTIFEFVSGAFPVSDESDITKLRGKYFSSLEDDVKRSFWSYQFLVEYVPTDDESIINGIFDRINRNVAKLTPQELRHAKLDGVFIGAAESLSDWISEVLPKNIPRFASQSKKQMKDVEFVALLLLLLEEGPRGYSQADLDKAFSDRDQSWDRKGEVEDSFRATIQRIAGIFRREDVGFELSGSRLKNQADFYSLVGAIFQLQMDGQLAGEADLAQRLVRFARRVEDPSERERDGDLAAYYEAARSASNDKGPRETRISYFRGLLASGAS